MEHNQTVKLLKLSSYNNYVIVQDDGSWPEELPIPLLITAELKKSSIISALLLDQ